MPDPARAMTKEDAFAELESLANAGVILFEGEASPTSVSLDGLDPNTGALQAGNVAGVIVRFGTSPAAPDRLDPRNALALVRFCQFLVDSFGATDLFHLGISGGGVNQDGTPRIDCHGQGRAVDFAGVTMPVNGTPTKITVLNHWGNVGTGATPGGNWPAGTGSDTHFRLDEADASPLGNPDGDAVVADFFRRVYDFIAQEWQDRSDNPDPAEASTSIGERSFIMHPDHPATAPGTPHGREAHKDHLHMQIGKTGTE